MGVKPAAAQPTEHFPVADSGGTPPGLSAEGAQLLARTLPSKLEALSDTGYPVDPSPQSPPRFGVSDPSKALSFSEGSWAFRAPRGG